MPLTTGRNFVTPKPKEEQQGREGITTQKAAQIKGENLMRVAVPDKNGAVVMSDRLLRHRLLGVFFTSPDLSSAAAQVIATFRELIKGRYWSAIRHCNGSLATAIIARLRVMT